jgi:hypothetical protein
MTHKKTAIGFPPEKDFPRQVKWYHKEQNYASKNRTLQLSHSIAKKNAVLPSLNL